MALKIRKTLWQDMNVRGSARKGAAIPTCLFFAFALTFALFGICEAGAGRTTANGGTPRESESAFVAPSTDEISFASDVVLHVVFHELGHALIREFDLPVLGNEETMADAFATHILATRFPDRAVDVLTSRTQSLMIEAAEVPREEWTVFGEHNNDARRAAQIAALAVAFDADKYRPVAEAAGLDENDVRRATDYGTEIHRSWRRVLQPLMMPEGLDSREIRFQYDEGNEAVQAMVRSGITSEIEAALKGIDWHSQVTVRFAEGDGGAGWSRSSRTITVNSEYIERFLRQARVAASDR